MQDLKVGIVGLGRIGKSHAVNLLQTIGCKVYAACSIVPEELDWAKEKLGADIKLYSDYDTMLSQSNVDAVFLATTTAVHAEQITKAFESDKHVFCEKPLGVNADESKTLAKSIEEHVKKKVFMMGFVRRYDPAYAFAKAQVDEGLIGEVFLVRAQTADHDDFAPFQVNFVKTGGGIFHDMNVHDIDIARWFLEKEFINSYAIGTSFVHKEFDSVHDADNTCVTSELEDGKMAVISACRTSFAGHETRAEIFGTKGILRIGFNPAVSDVVILDSYGQRTKNVYTFFDRFNEAFRLEAMSFIQCVLGNEKPRSQLHDALQATLVAEMFTKSFKEKRIVKAHEV